MNSYLGSFGPALANHLWQCTVFTVMAWLLMLALGKNQARVRYGDLASSLDQVSYSFFSLDVHWRSVAPVETVCSTHCVFGDACCGGAFRYGDSGLCSCIRSYA